jgi:hypothetical protein
MLLVIVHKGRALKDLEGLEHQLILINVLDTLGLIFLSLDPSLKLLMVDLDSPEAAYKAICARYKPTEASQQMHLFNLFFLLKMEDGIDLQLHFDWD